MSRVECRGESFSMAFGVDHLPNIGAFVQVWDHTVDDMPFNEGEEGGTNIAVDENTRKLGGKHLSEERVIQLARKYEIPIDERRIYQIFD